MAKRWPHRPREVGLRKILGAKFRYTALRQEHSHDSIQPWTARRCQEVVAAEYEIKVDALRVWLTEANAHCKRAQEILARGENAEAHRLVGITKPRKPKKKPADAT